MGAVRLEVRKKAWCLALHPGRLLWGAEGSGWGSGTRGQGSTGRRGNAACRCVPKPSGSRSVGSRAVILRERIWAAKRKAKKILLFGASPNKRFGQVTTQWLMSLVTTQVSTHILSVSLLNMNKWTWITAGKKNYCFFPRKLPSWRACL